MKLIIDVPGLTEEDLAVIQDAIKHTLPDAVIAWLMVRGGRPLVRDSAIISAEPTSARPVAELYWAPFAEFGIPDQAQRTSEPPAWPITICATSYQLDPQTEAETIVIYWEERHEHPDQAQTAAEPRT